MDRGLLVPFVGIMILLALFTSCGGYGSGRKEGQEAEQKKAVEAGVGRWVVDEKTGDRRFEYGPAK